MKNEDCTMWETSSIMSANTQKLHVHVEVTKPCRGSMNYSPCPSGTKDEEV